ncbi:hypothetical protein Mtc_2194 [Methanocella conradii HZ254]|uniref:Uncharacterized protein n=1 Tax=Methanocella conradii (strain DSM 24694 / JCM 17849 / CGMCC 1.5162 / HZ254) TaxID=1041930 RepID=H8I9W9_METCZ|nr:hypothetical protein [Methanocella conradii]AFD00929.1 hypothetical protein Mtc_2194 [Methanocella conradii HZ254]MDI6897603.1 hypothetical protein [Methanocella conradii]
MRDWDVWQRHKDYNSVIALACELPKDIIEKLEEAGFIVDDGSRKPVKADQLFLVHVRDLDKKHYWKKYDEFKAKYNEEPRPVHLEEMPELIIRFLGNVTPDQCNAITKFTLDLLVK